MAVFKETFVFFKESQEGRHAQAGEDEGDAGAG